MIRPDLPVGSPERAFFFGQLRDTFAEDWEAARKAVADANRAAKGDLYFIRAGKCVKIGHSINIVNRLGKMQADNHEQLDCLLVLKGRGHEEPEWHERFAVHHIRGEWFRWCKPIAEAIEQGKRDNMKAGRLQSQSETTNGQR